MCGHWQYSRPPLEVLTDSRARLLYCKEVMDIRKAILIFAGTVCVGLGVLGMFLPLMPTTVFLLMAAYCYSRSSDKFHDWLLTNRLCGKYITNYRSGKGITAKQKFTTILTLWASIGLSMWIVSSRLWLVLLLAAIALGVTIHILWLKTYRPEIESETIQANA